LRGIKKGTKLDDSGKDRKPLKKWLQLVLIIVEITLFLFAWVLLILGIFRGYFAAVLIVALGIVLFLSFRRKSNEDE
jgi:Flp pilus assembly protein TadB